MSQHEPSAVPGAVITSDSVYRGRWVRKLIIGATCLIALGGLGAAGWYIWARTPLLNRSKPVTTTVNYSKLSPTEAITAAQTAVSSAHTPTEKKSAYIALGDAYSRSGQTSQTETAYQQALVYSPNDIPTLERLSDTYIDAGDKANAVKTLQKLIDAINTTNPTEKDWLLSRYQAELKYEQGVR